MAESLKHSSGNYTDEHVLRTAEMVGALSTAVEEVFHKKVCLTHLHHSKSTKPVMVEQVKRFISIYKRDRLFDFVKNRKHESFGNFKHDHGMPRPAKLKARLRKHLKNMENDYYTQEVHGVLPQ